jgi:hypothetical protein
MTEANMVTRYSSRKPTTGKATLCCEDRVQASTILDLSVPGCHLATSLPLHKGQCLQMDVYLSNQPPMRIDLGIVRWASDGKAGIEFIRMSDEDASQLRSYVGYVEKQATQSPPGSEVVMCNYGAELNASNP